MDGDCSRMALVVKRTTYSGVTVRVTKQPIHEATLERGTLEGRERKREIRMVEGPPGPGPPSVIEIYLAVISLFLPLRPVSFTLHKGMERIDEAADVMQTRICLVFRPRVRRRPSYERIEGRGKGRVAWKVIDRQN